MLIELTDTQASVVIGAMRCVASARNTVMLSAADRSALAAFHHVLLRRKDVLDIDTLPEPTSASLTASVVDLDARTHVVQFLVVMASVDG